MLNRLSAKMMPLLVSVVVGSSWVGCGVEGIDQVQNAVVVTKAAVINQADFDSYTNAVNLKGCSFVIGGGTGTFTPSSQLSQVLYGDSDGSKHKSSFAVPSINAGSATIDISSFEAEMANTGLALAGSNATVKIGFHGVLKVTVTVPIFGKLPADINIKSSSISAALSYDKATERAKVASVSSRFDLQTKNCGGSGWCNGILDGILKPNLSTWIEAPLRDALGKALDSQDVTDALQEGMVIMWNAKDVVTPPWTMQAKTLELSTGAFRFTAERTTP